MRTLIAILMLAGLAIAQDAQHQQGVQTRGDRAMDFSYALTTHHFLLTKDGGAIAAEAHDPNDKVSRDAIWQHMKHIAKLFSEGDFNIPMFIHGQTPPGVPTMKRLKDQITYRVQPTERGAGVRITTANPEALEAVHQFLMFQIRDHHTKDSMEVH
ncbi:MAG: hypothetical protein ACHP8B_08260 [Terriglobales bacterium]